MGALVVLAALAALAVAGGKSTSSSSSATGGGGGGGDAGAGGSRHRPIRRRRRRSPTTGAGSSGATPGTGVPIWDRDHALITAKAAALWGARSNKTPTAGARFVVTRDALLELWPLLPWPRVLDDQESVNVEGAAGVYEQKWVVEAGPQGNAMKTVWDQAVRFVNNLAYDGHMPD